VVAAVWLLESVTLEVKQVKLLCPQQQLQQQQRWRRQRQKKQLQQWQQQWQHWRTLHCL
jgi:hypothetical protein